MYLKRINTNPYNKYINHFIVINDYKVSIQANEHVSCIPKKNMEDPMLYVAYEVIVFYENEPCIPMAYKELFDKNGIAKYVSKIDVMKILNYIKSPICMTMEIECQ